MPVASSGDQGWSLFSPQLTWGYSGACISNDGFREEIKVKGWDGCQVKLLCWRYLLRYWADISAQNQLPTHSQNIKELSYVDILENQQKLLVRTITAETWYCEPGKCLFFENKRCQAAHQQWYSYAATQRDQLFRFSPSSHYNTTNATRGNSRGNVCVAVWYTETYMLWIG